MTGRKAAFTYAGAESKLGMACDSATPSDAKHTTPSATKTASAIQSCGQSSPNTTVPHTVMSATCEAVLVIALPAIPAR